MNDLDSELRCYRSRGTLVYFRLIAKSRDSISGFFCVLFLMNEKMTVSKENKLANKRL